MRRRRSPAPAKPLPAPAKPLPVPAKPLPARNRRPNPVRRSRTASSNHLHGVFVASGRETGRRPVQRALGTGRGPDRSTRDPVIPHGRPGIYDYTTITVIKVGDAGRPRDADSGDRLQDYGCNELERPVRGGGRDPDGRRDRERRGGRPFGRVAPKRELTDPETVFLYRGSGQGIVWAHLNQSSIRSR
jgi:hypothetical protein